MCHTAFYPDFYEKSSNNPKCISAVICKQGHSNRFGSAENFVKNIGYGANCRLVGEFCIVDSMVEYRPVSPEMMVRIHHDVGDRRLRSKDPEEVKWSKPPRQ